MNLEYSPVQSPLKPQKDRRKPLRFPLSVYILLLLLIPTACTYFDVKAGAEADRAASPSENEKAKAEVRQDPVAPPLRREKKWPIDLKMKTIASHPHDRGAYTQGLIFDKGFFYESTGQYGRSSIRKVEIATGKPLQNVPIQSQFFGEGIERVGNRIYMLTWQEGLCFVFDRETLKFQKSFRYPGEGWGLAYDGTHLILSDGTATLRFYDPDDFSLKKKLLVYEGQSVKTGHTIDNINELEMVGGELWANIWKSSSVIRIDPQSGRVIGRINFAAFVPKDIQDELRDPRTADRVLNGIAYDPEKKRIYITGKEWPVLYELQLDDLIDEF